jgi:hypothetical protein
MAKLRSRHQIIWQATKHAVADLLLIFIGTNINDPKQYKNEPKTNKT